MPAGTSVLEAAHAANLPMASACGAEGICARCGVRILQGADSLPPETSGEADVKRRNRVDPELRLACRITLGGDLVVSAPFW
ncbi:MAG: (2Fe-2S)-binding protein [Deltaproteobacteria bacterium]|nr:(2Fe-2S)-binding protein [Deltaproteobacteria bacterium]MBW2420486.1 (2Fe-2S)-binding protein [Deltaproteobacteria bacterium]